MSGVLETWESCRCLRLDMIPIHLERVHPPFFTYVLGQDRTRVSESGWLGQQVSAVWGNRIHGGAGQRRLMSHVKQTEMGRLHGPLGTDMVTSSRCHWHIDSE